MIANLDCGIDENENTTLFEIDSTGNRKKVATLLSGGSVKFKPSYNVRSKEEKDAFIQALRSCHRK